MHVELLAGKTTKVVMCILCGAEIPVGEIAVYYRTPPKGSAHLSCHVQRRRR